MELIKNVFKTSDLVDVANSEHLRSSVGSSRALKLLIMNNIWLYLNGLMLTLCRNN